MLSINRRIDLNFKAFYTVVFVKFLAYVSGYFCILVLLYSAAVYNYMIFNILECSVHVKSCSTVV